LKRILIAITAVWAVFAVALLALPRLVGLYDFYDYRGLLVSQLEAATGRQASIGGDVTLTLFPTASFTADDVRIANVEGAAAPYVINAPRVVFGIEPASILSRKLRITRVVLKQPELNLEVLKDGRKSWDFHPGKARKPGKRLAGFEAREATIVYRAGNGAATLKGDVTLDASGERPRITATLTAGAIDLDQFLPEAATGPDKARGGGERWSRAPLGLEKLRGADLTLALDAAELRYGRHVFDKPALKAVLDGGVLKIERMSAGLLGGQALITGSVDARAVPAVALDLSLKGASLQQALAAWTDREFATGTLDLTASVTGKGDSQYAIVSSLSGTAMLDARNGSITGFDTGALSSDLMHLTRYDDFFQLADTAMRGGQSPYSRIGGGVKIGNGVARLDNFSGNLASARATAQGSVDLPRWQVDMDVSISLTGEGRETMPPVTMALRGRLDAPEQDNDLKPMTKYVGKKLLNTVVHDLMGDEEPHAHDMSRAERHEQRRRVINGLMDRWKKHGGNAGRQNDDYRKIRRYELH
jgi:uncharacterized protein involved in outer membrane biogenesis